MTHTRRAAVAVVVASAVLALGACAGVAGGALPMSPEAAEPTDIAARLEFAGIAPDLIYVTEVAGFDLATQSVGVFGDDGMSAFYVRSDGAGVRLMTSRLADPTVALCADLPDSSAATLQCIVELGAAHVRLEGEGEDVDAATLREAAQAVRVPRADELGHLFAELPTQEAPVGRPDLPQVGEVDPDGTVEPPNPLGG